MDENKKSGKSMLAVRFDDDEVFMKKKEYPEFSQKKSGFKKLPIKYVLKIVQPF